MKMAMHEIRERLLRTYPAEKMKADFAGGVVVGAVYRPLSFALSAIGIRLGISANQVTYVRYIAIVAECVAFTSGTYVGIVIGAVCHASHVLLDYVDGNIARYHARPTRFGALLDGMADRLGYILPPTLIGIGLFRRPDQLTMCLPASTREWVPLAMGVVATLGTVLLSTWNLNRLGEFLALVSGGREECNRAITKDAATRDRLWITAMIESAFSNFAQVLETGIILLAAFDVVSLFLLFRFVYYVISRLWLLVEHLSHRPSATSAVTDCRPPS